MFKIIIKVFLLSFLIGLIYISVNYLFFKNGKAEGNTTVKLVSFNVLNLYSANLGNKYFSAMKHNLDLMELYDPDVLLLQEHYEILRSFSDIAIRDTLGLNHYKFFPYGDGSSGHGMAIYSRFPMKDIEQIKLRPQCNRSLGLVELEIDDRILNVGVVHFPNKDMRDDKPRSRKRVGLMFLLKEFFGENIRTIQAKHLVEVTQDLHNSPLVIGGDFNTVPFSRAWRLMHGAFVDGSSLSNMLKGTRSVSPESEFEVKIDHFFHTKSVESIESSVGYKQGSDHRPIIMEIRF